MLAMKRAENVGQLFLEVFRDQTSPDPSAGFTVQPGCHCRCREGLDALGHKSSSDTRQNVA